MEKKKNYLVIENGKDTKHQYKGSSPRQVALKMANRGIKDIQIRERGRRNKDGSRSIHVFTGDRKQVAKPENAPEWMPAKIWKPLVKKVRVEHK